MEALGGLVGAELEEVEGSNPILRGVTLIRAGTSKNRRVYSREVLERDGPATFEGSPAFVTNHDPWEKNLRTLVGQYKDVRYETDALKADLHVLPAQLGMVQAALEAQRLFGPDKVGLSISTAGDIEPAPAIGLPATVKALHRVPETSVDLVLDPAAGGKLAERTEGETDPMRELIALLTLAMVEAMAPEQLRASCGELTAEQIRECNPEAGAAIVAKLEANPATPPAPVTNEQRTEERTQAPAGGQNTPDVASMVQEQLRLFTCGQALEAACRDADPLVAEALRAKFTGRVFEASELDTEAARLRDLAGRANPNPVNVPGAVRVVAEAADVRIARLEAAVNRQHSVQVGGRRVEAFHSITEALIAFHPEIAAGFVVNPQAAAMEALPLFTWGGGVLRESVDTSTFANAWANVLYKALMRRVDDEEAGAWRSLVSDYVNFRDLSNNYKFVRVSEVGKLTKRVEGETYTEIGTYEGDKAQEFGIDKYGDLYVLTWEALLRDDIGVLARIPQNLGNAWTATVHDCIFGLLQENAGAGLTMDHDSKALYHADHGNIHDLAFSVDNLETVRRVMVKHTDPTSGRRKNYRARFLLYTTPELDQSIWTALQSTFAITSQAAEINLPNFIRGYLGLSPVPVLYPTDTTTRWELMADPSRVPTIAVGFLGGRQAPDLFIQDQETVGSRFTSDKITYKVRGTVGATILDERAFALGKK